MKSPKFKNAIVLAVLLSAFQPSCKKDKYLAADGKCPLVILTDPLRSATGVSLNKVIAATFNEKMNSATFNQESLILTGAARIAGTTSYNTTDSTLRFIPDAPLIANTTYTAKVAAGLKDNMGNALQADYVWEFTTGSVIDTVAPSVISTDPVNLATGVPINKVVSATFSELMDPASVTDQSFLVSQGTTSIAGTVSFSGTVAFFSPSVNWSSNTVYSATISTIAKNLAGTPLVNAYVWSFTTGSTTVAAVPLVIATIPLNNATNVPLNQIVAATFNMPMDPATISGTSFLLKQGANTVAGSVAYSGSTASFTPSAALLPGLVYTATITTAAQNLAGISISANYIWSFTTLNSVVIPPIVTVTDPLNNATNVPVNKIITATFDQTMDGTTITGLSFLLKQGATTVNGVVAYSGNTASFTPSANLLNGVLYSATITTAVENLAGTPIANNYVWTFSTAATPTVAPFVDLKSAADYGILAGVGVSNNAGFSEIHDMNVGISPGVLSSVTGFPPAIIVNGAMHASDSPNPIPAQLVQAKQDLTAAYLFAEGATSPAPATVSGDLGGQTLAPGIYKSTSTLMVQSGNLTLDAGGNPNAFWVFQIASAFTTVGGAGGSIILAGGAQAKNIFWQTGSSATIGDNTAFHGNVLALTSITMNSNATAVGRMLARNGSVVLTSTNIINKP